MYKNYSSLVFIIFLFNLNIVKAQTTYVPDNNFEQALIDQGYDAILDNYVLTSNISNIVELNISSKGIIDLTGIQDFENLQSLDCKDNLIRNLDMSQNKQLKYLRCHYNAIQSLNISGNPELEILNCRNNVIGNLNVDKNTKLKVLNCVMNSLADLNISQNSVLTTLYCRNNRIRSLDLSKNKQLEILRCNDNWLSYLNVNNGANSLITDFDASGGNQLSCIIVDNADDANAGLPPYDNWVKHNTTSYCENPEKTFVPDDIFEQALIDLGYDDVLDDYVITANISNITELHIMNQGIADLTGIEGFISLKELWCENNQLVSLSLTQNKSLFELDCSGNQLTSLDLTQNTDLYALRCGYNQLTNLDVTQNTGLDHLICSNNPLTSLDLSKNGVLFFLNCRDTQLSSLNLKSGSNTVLREMYATNNPDLACIEVDDEDWANSTPEDNFWYVDDHTIYANDCNYGEKTYVPDDKFEQALIDLGYDDVLDDYVLTSTISNMVELDVSSKNIEDLTGIQDFKSLRSLHCNDNLITNLDVSQNIELINLTCNDNRIQNINLNNVKDLLYLDCSNNRITDLDISKKHMTALNCKNNELVSLNAQGWVLVAFDATGNPALECILVDDVFGANAGIGFYRAYKKDDTTAYCDDKTYVPDDNFERFLICSGYDDIMDDTVLTSVVKTVKELDLGSPGNCPEFGAVVDLTGIEDFTALETLKIDGHFIKIVDLTKNTSLLHFSANQAACDNVNLTKNTALLSFTAHGTSFGTIDLTKNAALERIDLYDPGLYELDLSYCPNLTSVTIGGPRISKINLKNGNNSRISSIKLDNLPNISCIQVDDPAWASANWGFFTEATYSEDCYNDGKTNIWHNNFERALIDLGYDDVLDGYVLTSTISKIEELDVSNKNLRFLSGIQDFKSLRALNCKNNQIENLDVSQNIQLQYLQCHYNQLYNIDVSNNLLLKKLNYRNNHIKDINLNNNTKLELLNCLNNKISDLDLSKNTALTTLYCSYNDIIGLDLSKNNKLEILNCKKNELSYLNVQNGANVLIKEFNASGNANLKCIQVDDPAWAIVNWTSIDPWTSYSGNCNFDWNTYIPDNKFEQALIDQGYDDVLDDFVFTSNISNVENLNISSYNIEDLTGIEGFISLRSLKCPSNQITNLDMSKNIHLEYLTCHDNQIQEINLNNNTMLEFLECRNNRISDLDLSKNIALTDFNATRNSLLKCIQVDNASDAIAGVAPYSNWNIDPWTSFSEDCENDGKTDIPDNNFEQALIDLGHDDVLDGYVLTSNITGIKELDVNNRNISNLSGIQDFKSLRSLICNDNQLTGLDLSQNIELRNLRCQENQLTGLDLSKNKALLTLSCRNNQITALDLSQNTALALLRCNKNELTALDLRENSKLELLVCSHNKLVSLDVKSGGNSILTTFSAVRNSSLQCIQIDNAMDAITGITPYDNWSIDALANYSEDCNYNTQAKIALNMEDIILSNAITIYPNPVNDHLNIDSGLLKLSKVEVYTILGQKVKEVNSNLNAIELNNLSSGLYLIRLYSKKGVIVRKIIKSE